MLCTPTHCLTQSPTELKPPRGHRCYSRTAPMLDGIAIASSASAFPPTVHHPSGCEHHLHRPPLEDTTANTHCSIVTYAFLFSAFSAARPHVGVVIARSGSTFSTLSYPGSPAVAGIDDHPLPKDSEWDESWLIRQVVELKNSPATCHANLVFHMNTTISNQTFHLISIKA